MFQTRAAMWWRAASWRILLAAAAAILVAPAVRAQDELGGPGMDDLRNEVGQ